jgi:glycosyltransferase involved in cell wall biosynthesis
VRILVVSTWWPCPADNGSRVRAFELLRQLAQRHRLTLAAFGRVDGGEAWEPLQALCGAVYRVPPAARAGALRARGLLSPTPRHFAQTDSPAMRALVERETPSHDLVLALQIDAARYVPPDAAVPCVFDEVELTVLLEQAARAPTFAGRLRHSLTWAKHRRYVRHVLGSFDVATVVSKPERDVLVGVGCDPSRVGIVPNGVSLGPGLPWRPEAERLIYPGPVTYEANLDAVRHFALDVLPLIQRHRPGVSLWVTGATSDVDVSGLASRGVRFTGLVPDVDPLLAGSVACVVPLRIGGGTRLKVLKAIAAGVPVVSTSKGIEGLDLDERHVCVADGAERFAERVLWVMDHRAEAARVAAAARDRVATLYEWHAVGAALENVMAQARARAGTRPAERRSHAGF